MPKPKIPNQRKANIEHKKRTERYTILIHQVYDRMAQEAARLAVIAGANTSRPFSFADYPLTKESIKRLQTQLMNDVGTIIMSGTSEEWKESNLVQDLVAKKVLTAYTGTSNSGEEYSRYFETNPDSLKAFQQRKENGMNLSSRVWNLSEQYKHELEEAITAAIAPGTSAMSLAAQVKKYLKEPDKRFRRIKEKMEDGTIKWHLSKNAKAYHPGQGVYRSSARNAQRLARTEINMAYRTAEQERWKQFDFVVGYEVKTTQNGHHVEDMCDMLAGKYPKDFKFTGWHPQCMCYCIPILKTEDEFWADDDVKSVNEVTDVPQNFKDWINDNSDRIEAAEKRGTLPYFIRDNRDDVENVLYPELRKKTPIEIASERHAARSAADIKDIKDRWNAKLERDANIKMVANNVLKVAQQWSEIDYSQLEQMVADNNITALTEESRKVAQAVKAMRDEEKALSDLIPDVQTWHDQFSIEELKAVKEAVSNTISKLDQSTFESFKSNLAFEADWVIKNSSYATKFVAEAAYKNQIKIVNEKIYWRDIKSSSENYISKLESVNPKLAKKLSKDFDVAVANGNKKGAEAYIYNLSKWDKIINLHSSLSNGGIDIADFEKFIKEGKLNKAWTEYNKLKTSQLGNNNLEEYCAMQYTTKFNVHDQDSYTKTMKILIGDCHDAWINAPEEERRAIIKYTGSYSKEMIVDRASGKSNELVTHLDSLLDKIKLSEDMVLRSGQDLCVPRIIFGDDFANILESEDLDSLNKKFSGHKGFNGGYMSTSYNELGGFGDKDIEFHIFAPKGTHGMIANQISSCAENRGVDWDAVSFRSDWRERGESEFLLHGGYIYKFIKAEKDTRMSDTGIRLYIQILGRK
ncbi:hypothetical protein EEL53_10170 [Muribaculaceae bacterium Isolate-114 (HZI)]|nr:hypothetical protein EEL53_10170 [Muribaculaceae bacterium Isolate-114 (HZI)]